MGALRRGTNLPKMGDFNESVVVEAVRRSGGGLSRIELAEATGLSAQTVTNIVRRLIDRGIVREGGRTISGPGKPRTQLELVPRSHLAVGVHLDPTVTTCVVLDLLGDVVSRKHMRTPAGDSGRVIRAIVDLIEQTILDSGAPRSAVAGVGIATPGPLDATRGTVIEPPKLHQWHRVPLRDALAEATGLPVTLEKDTTASAFAELWRGDDGADMSLLFVYLGTGIGTAVVLDGEVVRGRSRNVGEVGHIIVDPDGPLCERGHRGCVDAVCTPQAIVDNAERAGVFGDDARDALTVGERVSLLCQQEREGDAAAREVLLQTVEHYSVFLSAIMNLLDLDRVVLGGPFWEPLSDIFIRELPRLLDEQSATRAIRSVTVAGSAVGADVSAVGAACVVLDDVLSPRPAALLLAAPEQDSTPVE